MGCHTWWYRLLQEDEAKYFVKAWIKSCNYDINRTKNIILNKGNIDETYLDIVKDSAKEGYYDLDKNSYFNYIIYDDYYMSRSIKEYLEKSSEPYTDLSIMIYTYPTQCPFDLKADTFSDKIYISLFAPLDNDLLDKKYYKKLKEYEDKFNHHDIFRFYKYDYWINSIGELKTLLNSRKIDLSKGITNDNILEYYQEIMDKFGDCKIKFG